MVYFKFNLGSFTCARFCGSFCYLSYFLFLGLFRYKLNFGKFITKNIKIFLSKKEYLISDIDIRPLKSIFYQFVVLSLLNMILYNVENVILILFLKN